MFYMITLKKLKECLNKKPDVGIKPNPQDKVDLLKLVPSPRSDRKMTGIATGGTTITT